MGEPGLFNDPLTALVVDHTCLGQLYAAGSSMQEPEADGLFKLPDAAGQCGIGNANDLAGPTEALGLYHLNEEGHVVEIFQLHALQTDQLFLYTLCREQQAGALVVAKNGRFHQVIVGCLRDHKDEPTWATTKSARS
jgi:hypothetical protein